MTETYLLRHGRTSLSTLHQVNGDPAVQVALHEVGVSQCQAVADAAWIGTVVTCVTSRFLRTQQTADHLLGIHRPERFIEPRLDEVPYGMFEGGPWLTYGAWLTEHGPYARPPGGRESLHEATVRLLDGLASALDRPGPRLVVGHGHLVSLVQQLQMQPTSLTELRFPEATYVSPIVLSDSDLAACIAAGHLLLARLVTGDDQPKARR